MTRMALLRDLDAPVSSSQSRASQIEPEIISPAGSNAHASSAISPKSTDPHVPSSPVDASAIIASTSIIAAQKTKLGGSVERKTCCASVTCLPCITQAKHSGNGSQATKAELDAVPEHMRPLQR